MDARPDQQTRRRNKAVLHPAALGRWNRDQRSPARRLTPRPVDPPQPELTRPFIPLQQVDPEPVRLQPIQARSGLPFLMRETACPFLECRQQGRRCLSTKHSVVSMQRQARHCLTPAHRSCRSYRDARKYRQVPPAEAAFYTTGVFVILVLFLMVGIS